MARRLIAAAGKYDIDIDAQVELRHDVFRLALSPATVTLALDPASPSRLAWHCDSCDVPCEHAGAAFALILETELLPYQLEGIAFAAAAGRAVLADDMGLGKTIQGIGLAELLDREAGIKKVLIVCRASVKSQWCSEIRYKSTCW